LHAVVPHTYGRHGVDETEVQAPSPLHVAVGTAEPDVQDAALQMVLVPGKAPHAVRVDPLHCA
jgi:hypothetical protein